MGSRQLLIVYMSCLISVNHAHILLYDTETSDSAQHAYCIYWMTDSTMKYCRRGDMKKIFDTTTANECSNGGEKWLFIDAAKQNISPTEVISWSSSIERADDYADFYYNQGFISDESFLCKCTLPGTFGPRCEYQLFHEAITFEDAIKSQFKQKQDDRWGMQRYGDILCYTTVFECDYGLLCLDWRNICDGEQQCMDGTDEENCDLLEFNECEADEYRCVNGMCIREEYWLDGDFDCMDRSDERWDRNIEFCPYTPGSIECEEGVCIRQQWSCGDGQCIWGIYRLSYKRDAKQYCKNMREFNYICEIHPEKKLWTQPNGLCWNLADYDDPSDMDNNDLSNTSKCMYLIRCALSYGYERDCPCDYNNCFLVMTNVCETGYSYRYPAGRLIRPYISLFYSWEESWTKFQPTSLNFEGSIKCRGFYGKTEERVLLDTKDWYKLEKFPIIDFLFCNHEEIIHDYQSPIQYHESCWDEFVTFNKQPYAFFDICTKSYECISQYRIGDGFLNCGERENLFIIHGDVCPNLEKHRFQCSSQQSSCLPVRALGDRWKDCENGRDEFVDGLGEPLSEIECKQRNDDGCRSLKEYVSRDLHINVTNNSSENMLEKTKFSFRSYCDTFWNLPLQFDESSQHCQDWVCLPNQYQCQTGQCIELDWLCDREWDCPDASDEQAIHLNLKRLYHNTRLPDFETVFEICLQLYATKQPFIEKCNVTTEFPCLLTNVINPLDIESNPSCINLTQIGDGIEDCYGGLDEKNMLESCDGSMLGFSFRCENQQCFDYESLCEEESQLCRNEILCHYKSKDESCSAKMDVLCLDGSCKDNARCNGIFECPYGEDEYWCPLIDAIGDKKYKYRNSKENQKTYWKPIWPLLPSPSQSTATGLTGRESVQYVAPSSMITNIKRINTYYSDSYTCNRGVAVAYEDKQTPVCFCPPSYYGQWCQDFSDRLTVIMHLDLTSLPINFNTYRSCWFKIIASLLYVDRTIDFYEFDTNGNIEFENFVKHKFYLLYSLSNEMRKYKELRHFNRSDIINSQPYSIRFDVYRLIDDEIDELGSWLYPIYFDFLPAFRLATVLKFPTWYGNASTDPCANNTSCPQNAICRPIFNQKYPRFWCSCRNSFYGNNCELIEHKCSSYCSSNAFCKPESRGELTNTENPLCICPLHRFGPRCNLRHEECNSQPCLNNGTCHLRSDPSGQRLFICNCSTNFHGDFCEKSKFAIHINLNMSSNALASVVQLYDIHSYKLQLLIRHQQVMSGLPASIRFSHDKTLIPVLAVLKLYELSTNSKYYILYIQENVISININSTPKHCPHATSLPLMQSNIY